MVQERRVNEIKTPKTVREAVERGVPLAMVSKVTGPESVLYALEIALTDVMRMVNVNPQLNIQPHQTRVIAETILEQFKHESIEDFKLAFSKGSTGFYGEIYRLDGAVITRWIQLYLEEKYAYIETQHNREKGDGKETTVDYAALIERRRKELADEQEKGRHAAEKQKQLAKDMIEGKEPIEYVPDLDKAVQATVDNLYRKENYNLKTGARLNCWMEKEEWLLLRFPDSEPQPK